MYGYMHVPACIDNVKQKFQHSTPVSSQQSLPSLMSVQRYHFHVKNGDRTKLLRNALAALQIWSNNSCHIM